METRSVQEVASSDDPDFMFAMRVLEDTGAWFLSWQFQFIHIIEQLGGKTAPRSNYSVRRKAIDRWIQSTAEKIKHVPSQRNEPEASVEPPPAPAAIPPERPARMSGLDAGEEDELMRLLEENL